MKFRFGLIIGLAIGYVLGARAGYERYQQIQSAWRSVRGSEPARRLGSEVRDFADRASTRIEERATRGKEQLSSELRGGADGEAPSSELDAMR